MKKILAVLLAAATLLAATACAADADLADTTAAPSTTAAPATEPVTEPTTTAAPETEPPVEEPGLIYQAHRGLSTDFPENTMPAFEGAVEAGFKILEIDPNFTADEQCVLMHDATINRTVRNPDGSAIAKNTNIGQIKYDELLALDAGLWKGAQFKGTKVPLLSDVAAFAHEKGIMLKIDNKIQNYSDHLNEKIFALGEQYPAEMGFTCKTYDFVKKVIDRLPNAIIHYDGPSHEKMFKMIKNVTGDNPLYIWIGVANATPEMCETIKQYGYLGIWTVKSEAELEKAIALGADLIETNGEVRPAK